MVKAENHGDKEERARKEGREHVQRDAGISRCQQN